MTEPDFLDRLYNLKALPSRDARFTNAQGDISKHQVMNHSALRWRRVSRQLPRICNSTADSSTYPWLWKSGEVARHGALEADDRNTPETRHRSLRTPWNCDINDDIASFLARIAEDVGGLDGLVNNAGITVGGPVELLNEENWRQQSEVNFFGLVTHSMGIAASSRRV